MFSSFVLPALQLASHFIREREEEANAAREPVLIRHEKEASEVSEITCLLTFHSNSSGASRGEEDRAVFCYPPGPTQGPTVWPYLQESWQEELNKISSNQVL